jgi:hypothetical protein
MISSLGSRVKDGAVEVATHGTRPVFYFPAGFPPFSGALTKKREFSVDGAQAA